MIQVFQPNASDAELAAIGSVFSSSWLGTGTRVQEFEVAFGAYVGKPAAEMVAVSSATEGLFHIVAALGLGVGDDVVLPTVSFIGAAHAVTNAGARVVLCDVDPVTLNPKVEHVEAALTPATKAVLILHYGGEPGDLASIAKLAEMRSVLLIEDAAVGLGSFSAGQACGTFGDVGIWSFDSMKVMTTGDGGMVWSREPVVIDRIRRSTKLGLGASGFVCRFGRTRWWEIDPSTIGRRGTMNDVCAAMGVVQLERLPSFLRRRAAIAEAYEDELQDLSWVHRVGHHTPHAARTFAWIQTAADVRDRLADHLLQCGIYTTYKYWPLHRTAMYRSHAAFSGADQAARSTLLLPLHQALSDADVDHVLRSTSAFVA